MEPLKRFFGGVLGAAVLIACVALGAAAVAGVIAVGYHFGAGWALLIILLVMGGLAAVFNDY